MANSGRRVSVDTDNTMKSFKLAPIILVLAALFFSSTYAAEQPGLFKLNSYQEILQQNKQRAFLMVLWSLECAPCMQELKELGEFHQKYPQHKLILISTDSKQQSDEISQLMARNGLQDVNQWIFDDSFQYLRYSIDPNWYGELPRSYFYTQDHTRHAVSGQLHKQQLTQFFAEKLTSSGLQAL